MKQEAEELEKQLGLSREKCHSLEEKYTRERGDWEDMVRLHVQITTCQIHTSRRTSRSSLGWPLLASPYFLINSLLL